MINRGGKKDKYIIFEGPTEKAFLEKCYALFGSRYNLILVDAKGKDNILYKYKTLKKKNPICDVALMYDLDGVDTVDTILKQYRKKGIPIKTKDIYFINPKFEMLLIFIKNGNMPASNYSAHIKRIYGIDHYEKNTKQLKEIMKQITLEEIENLFLKMKCNISKNDNDSRSSNYDKLFCDIFSH